MQSQFLKQKDDRAENKFSSIKNDYVYVLKLETDL